MPELIISGEISSGRVGSYPLTPSATRLERAAKKPRVTLFGAILDVVAFGVFVIGGVALLLSALVPALFAAIVLLSVGLAPFLLVLFGILMTEYVGLPGKAMSAARGRIRRKHVSVPQTTTKLEGA